MKFLKACALISVCVIAATSLVLVAMGYTIQLEAPNADANPIGSGIVAMSVDVHPPVTWALLEDGSIYQIHQVIGPDISVTRVDGTGAGNIPTLPIPISDVLWWSGEVLIGTDGLYYAWHEREYRWLSTPMPGIPVGAAAGSLGDMKRRYGSGNGN